jgi:hypothetical protein
LVGEINGEIANVNPGATLELLFFNTLIQITQGAFVEAVCNFVNGFLQCNDAGDTIFEYCGPDNGLIITTAVSSDCEQIQLVGLF